MVYDSGKTWFTISLAKKLISKGFKVSIFKPVAGHSAWYQYSTVAESFKRGILLGEDVVKYSKILGVDNNDYFTLINPVDILFAPLDIIEYIGKDMKKMFLDLENHYLQMVLARVSLCSTNITKHYVFKENTNRIVQSIRNVITSLAVKLNAEETSIENFIKFLQSKEIDEELNVCLHTLLDNNDIVLIESFNNSLLPYVGLAREGIDIIFVIYPGVAIVYRNKVNDIIELIKKNAYIYGDKILTSEEIISRIKYDKHYLLKPRNSPQEEDEIFEKIFNEIISKKFYSNSP